MAEYVVKGAEPNETVLHTRTPNGYEEWRWLPVREQIVRCKDCKYVSGDCEWCKRHPEPRPCDDPYEPEENDIFYDGFCAWGVRRNDA